MSTIYAMHLPLMIALNSRDLSNALSTLRNFIDKPIRADVSCVRYKYEMGHTDEIV